MIAQSAFWIEHPLGNFVGIVAFNRDNINALEAAQDEWGKQATYKELTAEELTAKTRAGCAVFTSTHKNILEKGFA